MSASAGAVASTLARLRNIADASELSFNDVLQRYVTERFLARLATLPDAETVLLKGALMLGVWGVPRARPTMDIDLLRRGPADRNSLLDFVARCAAVPNAGDVVEFDAKSLVAEAITEDAAYSGTRLRLIARLGNVRQTVQVDFGVGDAVFPGPLRIEFPVLLGGQPIRLDAYPVEASIAEKFHAIVVRELRNSRMKDFYDIWILSRNCSFSREVLRGAIESTFHRRETALPAELLSALTEAFFADATHVRQWRAFTNRIGAVELANSLPQVATDIAAFLMPVVLIAPDSEGPASWRAGGPWERV
ncbi:MAG: nucleotidyl transferase AbiEii/AbiGii toxin family protein [Pseudomonadota bacterium]